MRIVLFNFHQYKQNPVYPILAEAFRKRGHEVIMAANAGNGWFELRGDGDELLASLPIVEPPAWTQSVPLLSRLSGSLAKARLMLSARAEIARLRPDILQINTHFSPWLLTVGMPANLHVMLDIRQINEAVKTGWRPRLREKLNVQTSRFNARHVFERTFFCHVEAAKHIVGDDWQRFASVVPVGVDDIFLAVENPPTVPLAAEPVNFVYIGTLSRLRNLEQLFRAAKLLSEETNAFRVTLVGPDQTKGGYQRAVDELGVSDLVAIEPPLPYDDIPGLLATQDVGLAYVPDRPTWHYQPTIKALEYRAIGLPILSTDVASHREIIVEGENGLLVADEPAAIADGMKRFVLDRTFLATTMANAAAMRRGLDWDDVAEMYEQTYLGLIHTTPETALS